MNRTKAGASQMKGPGGRLAQAGVQGCCCHQPVHHRDPSPAISLLVAIGFAAILIGWNEFSNYLEHAGKHRAQGPAHNLPMIHMRLSA